MTSVLNVLIDIHVSNISLKRRQQFLPGLLKFCLLVLMQNLPETKVLRNR